MSSLKLRFLVPLFFLLCGILIAFHPMIVSGFALMQADPGDTRLYHYIFENSYQALLSLDFNRIWNPDFFYPVKNTGMFTDLMLGFAPFYWVFRILGFRMEHAFQGWMLSMAIINFTVFFVFLRHWFCKEDRIESVIAAALGAFLFSFANSRLNQLGHQQLLPQFYPVIAMHALGMIFRGNTSQAWRRTAIAGFCLMFVLQLYSGFYYGWFMVFATCLAGLAALALRTTRIRMIKILRDDWLTLFISSAFSLLLLWPLIQHAMQAAALVGYRQYAGVLDQMPTPQSWFYMGKDNPFYPWLNLLKPFRTITIEPEHRLGIGFVTLTFVILGFVQGVRRHIALKISLVVILGSILLLTQFKHHSLWGYFFDWFPGAKGIRVFARMGVFLLAFHGIAFAIFAEQSLVKLQQNTTRRLALILLLLVCVGEQFIIPHSYVWAKHRADVEVIKEKILVENCKYFILVPDLRPEGKSLLQLPPATRDCKPNCNWKYQIDAMLAQLETGRPTLNGYSGKEPPSWPFFYIKMYNDKDHERLRSGLTEWTTAHAIERSQVCWIPVFERLTPLY